MPINTQVKKDLLANLGVEHGLELMNLYKGVPLVYKATLAKVGDDGIQMVVAAPESICLLWEQSTIILDDRSSLALKAQVGSFLIEEGSVELINIQYTDRGFGVRTMVRVEPVEPIPIKISRNNQTTEGEILDISLTGFGIRVSSLVDPPYQTRDPVGLALNLAGKEIRPSGTVISVIENDGESRLAVHFSENESVPFEIAHYITHRRAEIRQELREAYEAAYQDAVS